MMGRGGFLKLLPNTFEGEAAATTITKTGNILGGGAVCRDQEGWQNPGLAVLPVITFWKCAFSQRNTSSSMLPGQEVQIATWRSRLCWSRWSEHTHFCWPALALVRASWGIGCHLTATDNNGVFERVPPVGLDLGRPPALPFTSPCQTFQTSLILSLLVCKMGIMYFVMFLWELSTGTNSRWLNKGEFLPFILCTDTPTCYWATENGQYSRGPSSFPYPPLSQWLVQGKEWKWEGDLARSQALGSEEVAQAADPRGEPPFSYWQWGWGSDFPVTSPHSGAANHHQILAFLPWCKAEMAVISAEWLVLDIWATDLSTGWIPPMLYKQRRHYCNPFPRSVCNHSCGLLQVEDLTASHEATLLEMENNHTVAIAILQDDHHHKVQGSYQPQCVWPCGVGCVSQTFAAVLPLLPLFLFSLPLLPGVSFLLLPMERSKNPGSIQVTAPSLGSIYPHTCPEMRMPGSCARGLGPDPTWHSHVAALGFLLCITIVQSSWGHSDGSQSWRTITPK